MSSRNEGVSHLDGDEFIALGKPSGAQARLADDTDADAVSLNWHCSGNIGLQAMGVARRLSGRLGAAPVLVSDRPA
jgi:hypothetical protein